MFGLPDWRRVPSGILSQVKSVVCRLCLENLTNARLVPSEKTTIFTSVFLTENVKHYQEKFDGGVLIRVRYPREPSWAGLHKEAEFIRPSTLKDLYTMTRCVGQWVANEHTRFPRLRVYCILTTGKLEQFCFPLDDCFPCSKQIIENGFLLNFFSREYSVKIHLR